MPLSYLVTPYTLTLSHDNPNATPSPLPRIEHFLRLISPSDFLVVVIAGHGTGVVKKVVREHLKTCRYATAHGPADFEQGGDALMVVALE